jgi:radical SAM superfamily enzyme YgiQ (UPF0313 family)
MKRIVLFCPSHKFGGSVQPRIELPLCLLSVATPLDRAGYTVRIIDQRVESHWREEFSEELDKGPICVGITSMTGPQIRHGLEASRLAREHGGIPVVWGGIHPTLLPRQTLENDNIDIVVQGEGEESFFELVQALEGGSSLSRVRGIWYKEDGEINETEPRPPIDLNEQPPLSYHLVDISKYMVGQFGRGHLSFESSRGCRFRCSFCYNTRVHKSTWRGLTVDETIRRMKILIEEHGVREFLFSDDNFFGDKEMALGILRRIKEEKLGISISEIDTHISGTLRLTDSELGLIRDSGCKMLKIGAESGSPRVLKMIRKGLRVTDLLEFNRRLRGFGLTPFYFLMVGYPTETLEELSETVSLYLRLMEENDRAAFLLAIFTPFPGTELYDISVQHGFRVPRELEEWVALNPRTASKDAPWLSEERRKLIQMLHFATLLAQKNYFRSSFQTTNPLADLLARTYRPIARKRVENLFYKLPVEVKLAEWLRIYPRQV